MPTNDEVARAAEEVTAAAALLAEAFRQHAVASARFAALVGPRTPPWRDALGSVGSAVGRPLLLVALGLGSYVVGAVLPPKPPAAPAAAEKPPERPSATPAAPAGLTTAAPPAAPQTAAQTPTPPVHVVPSVGGASRPTGARP